MRLAVAGMIIIKSFVMSINFEEFAEEYCIALKQFIVNNNLFYFSRKWDIIKLKENE